MFANCHSGLRGGISSLARVFAVFRLHFFAHVHATLQLVENFFKLLHGVNGFAARNFLEQGVLQFATVDNAPNIVIFRHLAQRATIAEYHERNKVRLFVTDFEKMFQCKNVSDILANRVVERVFGVCVQVLRPAFFFKASCNFTRKILAFEYIDSRLVQKQGVNFGVACAGGNVEVSHQNIAAFVGVADAGGERHHRGFAKNASRVVRYALVVKVRIRLEKVFAAGWRMRNAVAAQFVGLSEILWVALAESLVTFLLKIAESLASTIVVVHFAVLFRRLALDLEKDKGQKQNDADKSRKSHAASIVIIFEYGLCCCRFVASLAAVNVGENCAGNVVPYGEYGSGDRCHGKRGKRRGRKACGKS